MPKIKKKKSKKALTVKEQIAGLETISTNDGGKLIGKKNSKEFRKLRGLRGFMPKPKDFE